MKAAPHFASVSAPASAFKFAFTFAFFFVIGICTAGASHAANVNISVTDAAGKPLAGAVAYLQAAAGKLAAKPLAGIEISQAKRQFAPRVTIVTVGTPVTFPNLDTVRHHVFSFSPIKTFELKLYAGVPNVPVLFDKPGFAVLGCNIHDQMAAWVAVLDTPLFAQTAVSGKARIEGAAAGSYKLRVWHPGLGANDEPAAIAINVGAVDLEQGVKLNIANNPLAAEP